MEASGRAAQRRDQWESAGHRREVCVNERYLTRLKDEAFVKDIGTNDSSFSAPVYALRVERRNRM
jgi:hypothetical protein